MNLDKLKEAAAAARDRPNSDDWNPVSEFEWEASPLTILALIERLEVAERFKKWDGEAIDSYHADAEADATRLKAAEELIEAWRYTVDTQGAADTQGGYANQNPHGSAQRAAERAESKAEAAMDTALAKHTAYRAHHPTGDTEGEGP